MSRLDDVRDETLLSRATETGVWNYLLDYLRRTPEGALESMSEANVGFFELDSQAAAYRGRVVTITGRVLRCEFHATPESSGSPPPESPESGQPEGFYLCYVRMSDNAEIPLTLCVLDLPENFPVRQKMNETVTATGVFYKNRCLPIEADAYSSPTLLAKTFRWTPGPRRADVTDANLSVQQRMYRDYGAWIMCGTVLILWFFVHRHFRKLDLIRREKRSEPGFILLPPGRSGTSGSDTASGPEKSGETSGRSSITGAVVVVGAVVVCALCAISPCPAALDPPEPVVPTFDAVFVRMMMGLDAQQWELLDEKIDPLVSFRSSVLDLANRLHTTIPRYVLEHNAGRALLGANPERAPGTGGSADETAIPARLLLDDPPRFRGRVFRFREAQVVYVEEFPLSPSEREAYRLDTPFEDDAYRFKTLYRCRVELPDGVRAVVFTSAVPNAWPRDRRFRQPCGATGIYMQRIAYETMTENAETETIPDRTNELDTLFEEPNVAIALVAPRLEWYPDDPADPFTRLADRGKGVDAGTWDAIPNIAISDLTRTGTPGEQPRLDKGTMRKALWLTEADREPFYQTLGFLQRCKPGSLDRWVSEEPDRENRAFDPVVDLFRRPETQRARLVRLHGVAKRIIPTLITDRDIIERFGIRKYYQIYLFTADSQGNPVVFCTPTLPKGMPSGTDADFAETLTISGFFYKLWAYEAAAPDVPEPSTASSKPRTVPRYAPLLLGGDIRWESQEKPRNDGDERRSGRYGGTGVLLFLLLLVWIYFRFTRRPPPKTTFQIGPQDEPQKQPGNIRFGERR